MIRPKAACRNVRSGLCALERDAQLKPCLSISAHWLHFSCIRGLGCDDCRFSWFENVGQLEPSKGPNSRFWVKKTGLAFQ